MKTNNLSLIFKVLEIQSLDQYFDLIYNSFISGDFKTATNLLSDLTSSHRAQMICYLTDKHAEGLNENNVLQSFVFNFLLEN